MQHFEYNELKSLIEANTKPAVSLFLPTHEISERQNDHDQIELKNMLKHAEVLLEEHDLTGANTPELLKPAYDLLDDPLFWQHQNKGLAIYLAPDFMRIYRLPISFKKEVIVNSRFQITPLLPFFENKHSYYVLALSLNQVKLYEANEYSIEEVPTQDLPESLQDVLKYEDFEKQLQFHSTSTGGEDATYHGHADEGFTKKKQIHRYCQEIQKSLSPFLKSSKAPLVVAAVDYVFDIFKQHCDYAGLMDSAISGNPEHVDLQQLHQKSLALVRPHLEKEKSAALASIKNMQASKRLLCHTDQVLQAAYNSRVEQLFLMKNNHARGFVDKNGRVHRRAVAEGDEQDLVNLAAIHTLLNGGEVYTVDSDAIENATEVAAILRY